MIDTLNATRRMREVQNFADEVVLTECKSAG